VKLPFILFAAISGDPDVETEDRPTIPELPAITFFIVAVGLVTVTVTEDSSSLFTASGTELPGKGILIVLAEGIRGDALVMDLVVATYFVSSFVLLCPLLKLPAEKSCQRDKGRSEMSESFSLIQRVSLVPGTAKFSVRSLQERTR